MLCVFVLYVATTTLVASMSYADSPEMIEKVLSDIPEIHPHRDPIVIGLFGTRAGEVMPPVKSVIKVLRDRGKVDISLVEQVDDGDVRPASTFVGLVDAANADYYKVIARDVAGFMVDNEVFASKSDFRDWVAQLERAYNSGEMKSQGFRLVLYDGELIGTQFVFVSIFGLSKDEAAREAVYSIVSATLGGHVPMFLPHKFRSSREQVEAVASAADSIGFITNLQTSEKMTRDAIVEAAKELDRAN